MAGIAFTARSFWHQMLYSSLYIVIRDSVHSFVRLVFVQDIGLEAAWCNRMNRSFAFGCCYIWILPLDTRFWLPWPLVSFKIASPIVVWLKWYIVCHRTHVMLSMCYRLLCICYEADKSRKGTVAPNYLHQGAGKNCYAFSCVIFW